MTAPGEDVLAWLDAAIAAREQAARAANATAPAPWTADIDEDETGLLIAANEEPLWDCEGSSTLCMTAAASVHAALNDPESVLLQCAAERKLLELHAGKMHSCPATDETGYLDEWTQFGHSEVCPVVRLLAEGYGWTGGER